MRSAAEERHSHAKPEDAALPGGNQRLRDRSKPRLADEASERRQADLGSARLARDEVQGAAEERPSSPCKGKGSRGAERGDNRALYTGSRGGTRAAGDGVTDSRHRADGKPFEGAADRQIQIHWGGQAPVHQLLDGHANRR